MTRDHHWTEFRRLGFSMRLPHSHDPLPADFSSRGRSSRRRSATVRALRESLRGWLRSAAAGPNAKRGRLLLEALEPRQMLAGDVDLWATDGHPLGEGGSPPAAEVHTVAGNALPVTTQPEGEAADDLVQFAKDLAAAEVTYFGAAWCAACTQQSQIFAGGGIYLPFLEVTNPDRTLNQLGIDEGIEQFPTWEFPDGSREVGVLDLATLSARSGVPIPQGVDPTFAPLGPQTVRINSPLHVPVNAYDPNGGPLTVSVAVDNPELLEATVITGNRSLRLSVEGFGDMVFELFEQRAPCPAGRVIELAESGFYDGIIFHRVVNGFVIQGGDPTGTGTGGSPLGNFDDQFHPDLQHNRGGVLSFAKTTDDTNNSQFFITEVPTRFLDFNHSIFGQLVEGENVREAISNMQVDGSDRPTTPITIGSAEVFTDTENSVVMLKALGQTGQTSVTFTVTDQDGNSHSETVQVTIAEDNFNNEPFLTEIETPAPVPAGTPATLQLESIDIEGDPVLYAAVLQTPGEVATVTVDENSGLVTVTPADGFAGEVDVLVSVRSATPTNAFDSQLVTFTFEEVVEALTPPTSLELDPTSDTGASDEDNVTRAGTLIFHVGGVTPGATVEIIDSSDGTVIGAGVATGGTISISTNNIAALGDGTYQLAARQRNQAGPSGLSPILTLVYDSTPPASVLQSAPRQGNVGVEYRVDLHSPEEGAGLVYGFITAPDGATIDPQTGLIVWTPTQTQIGNNTFTLELTDLAGNVRTESYTVVVGESPIAGIRLEVTDLDGNVVESVVAGDEFLLRMYGVDNRSAFDRRGVFAAYADILFNPSLVRPVPGSQIQFANQFTVTRSGTLGSGLIDELGAASSNLNPTEEQESLIATVRMEAIAAGGVNFRSEPADSPANEVLLYLRDDQVPVEQVAYGIAPLTIALGFVLRDDAFTVAADAGPTPLDVLANDEVSGGSGPLAVTSVTQPGGGGSVTIVDGGVVFDPDPTFVGTSTFTYRASNPAGIESEATVVVTITEAAPGPIGVPDQFVVIQGSGVNSLDVLANDSPSPGGGQTLSVVAVSASGQGATVTVAADGQSVEYTPPADFVGLDAFTYTLSDGQTTAEVSVEVTVTTGEAAPVANPDAFTIDEDTPEAEYDVLANDEPDEFGEPFVLHSVGTPTQGGTARISDDGTRLVYAPAPNFNGVEQVTYTIRGESGGLASTTVTFTVNPVNDPPPAADRIVTLSRSSAERVVHRIADLPPNVDVGEMLAFIAVGTPESGGSVRISPDGQSILYTPPSAEFTGSDRFDFTVEDEGGLTSTATITVQVTDFAPRTIHLRFAGGASTLRYLTEAVTLTGTNSLGEPIERTVEVNGTHAFFSGLFPGDYRVHVAQIPFLQGAELAQDVDVTSGPDDGDVQIQLPVGRLRPEYLSVRDFLGSAKSSTLLAAVAPGQRALFAVPTSTVNTISNPIVEMSADGSSVTVRGTDADDQSVEATFPAVGDRRVQLRGVAEPLRLLRISLDSDDVPFDPPEGEGGNGGNGAGANGETSGGDGPLVVPEGAPALPLQGAGEGEAALPPTASESAEPLTHNPVTASSSAAPAHDLAVAALADGEPATSDPEETLGAEWSAALQPSAIDAAIGQA